MKRKLLLLTLLVILGVNFVGAQTESDGFSLLIRKDYAGAKKVFQSLLKAKPENATALFGLGEYYYYTGKMDSAKVYYTKGISESSSYAANYAGLGKISMLSASAEADAYFKDAVKKSKKDATALICMARYYYEHLPKKLDEARRYVEMAISIDTRNSTAYFLKGLIELDNNNASAASLQFDQVIYFDGNNMDAYIFQSRIMSGARNMGQAVDYLKRALSVNPSYWLIYKELGELYYDNQKYADAITNFEIYFKNAPQEKDLTHYAYSLFFNNQFDKARSVLDALIAQNPNDYVLMRLQGYICYETKDYEKGKSIMERLFALVPKDKVLSDDYSYYGKMLSVAGNDSLAVENYMLALKIDSTQSTVYEELMKSCKRLKRLDDAIAYGTKGIRNKLNIAASDYYNLGGLYYMTAANLDVKTDSVKRLGYLTVADSLFTKVVRMSPDSHLGVIMRARVNARIDRDATLALAKPFYERTLEIVKDPVKYKNDVCEAYDYLGSYYYLKDDIANSLEYWKKLLEIDPTNAKALGVINSQDKK